MNESEPEFLVQAMRQYRCVAGEPCAAGAQGEADTNKLAWTSFVLARVSTAFAESIERPMKAVYPHARLADYFLRQWDPDHCFAPDAGGFMACRG
eukprot:COSAG05_NODE_4406_length_1528_cov_1.801260_2_plen_94_part_01